jgi:hypothetical protein
MEILLFVGLLGGLGYWVYLSAFGKGKHVGSRKAYGIGRHHGKHGRRIPKPF